MYKLKLIKDEQVFLDMRAEWNNLLLSSNSKTIFLTWEWMYTWWQIYGERHELNIIIATDEQGTLLGIAPLMTSKKNLGIKAVKLVEFIAGHSVSAEYLDFICKKEYEKEITRAFIDNLLINNRQDLISFNRLPEESQIMNCIRNSDNGLNVFRTKSEEAYYIELPQNWDKYLSNVGKNTHRNIRRYRERVHNELGGKFRIYNVYDENTLDDVITLHQKRMKSMGRIGSFAPKSFIRFNKMFSQRAAEGGWLRIYFISIDDRQIAARYGFMYGNVFYDYSTGFDPAYDKQYVGFVLLSYCIEDCIQNKIDIFDFLGPGLYKERWNSKRKHKISIMFGVDNRALRYHVALINIKRFIIDTLKNIVPTKYYNKIRNIKNTIYIYTNKPLK